MVGATGNFYCGLHEFEEMAFVIHFLRPADLFVDVGANIGAYTILASGHSGATSISIEPLPRTFSRLRANVRYNDIDERVTLYNCGIGDKEALLRFTKGLDAMNHVAIESESTSATVEVPVVTMDSLLESSRPVCIKIDVEGFEKKVIDGGRVALQENSLKAVLVELNGSGRRYGFDDEEVHQALIHFGFLPSVYEPFSRTLRRLDGRNTVSGNTLYVRDVDFVRDRLDNADEIQLPWTRICSPIPSRYRICE